MIHRATVPALLFYICTETGAYQLRCRFDQIFERHFLSVFDPLAVKNCGIRSEIGKNKVVFIWILAESSAVLFCPVFHNTPVDLITDLHIAAGAEKPFIDRRHFFSIFEEVAGDPLDIVHASVGNVLADKIFDFIGLQFLQQVINRLVMEIEGFSVDPCPFGQFFYRYFRIIHFKDHIFKSFPYRFFGFDDPQVIIFVSCHDLLYPILTLNVYYSSAPANLVIDYFYKNDYTPLNCKIPQVCIIFQKKFKRIMMKKWIVILTVLLSFLNVFSVVAEVIKPAETSYHTQEIRVENNGQQMYGVAYFPELSEKLPIVLLAHGLGGSWSSNLNFAEELASHGVAAYALEFRGSGGSRSEGSTTEMSVMTEVSDLEAIIQAAKTWDFVDPDRIVLLGTSQGGIVSAITAARHQDDIAGLVLCYPAFLVSDGVHEMFNSLDEIPESYYYNWIMAGRPYAADMWDYDVYSEIGNYTDKVLLMHGDRDSIVPLSYAERAVEVYPNVEYHVIPGAGHSFTGSSFTESMGYTWNYLYETGVIGNANSETSSSAIRMDFLDGTVGYIRDLRDNSTTRAFIDMLPETARYQDWDGREYWISGTLPYDQESVQHTYDIGEFTYWCGGWITAYYATNEDTVIEAGSVVLGIMDENAVNAFRNANGAALEISFTYEP